MNNPILIFIIDVLTSPLVEGLGILLVVIYLLAWFLDSLPREGELDISTVEFLMEYKYLQTQIEELKLGLHSKK